MTNAEHNLGRPETSTACAGSAGAGVATPPPNQAVLPIPLSTLETLSLRFRSNGVFIVLMTPDGSVLYSDPTGSPFFQRYVLPLVRRRDLGADETGVHGHVRAIPVDASIATWDLLPGVALAAFPYVEKRQLTGVFLLAAKDATFKLGEDVVRVCSRLGLDGVWLSQQADELPAFTAEQLQRQARLVLASVRDQVRLTSLEKELDSLSAQLSNTYEELSLIYQLSSGMKVNRSAADFFKQACLDLMEVMAVRGMGVALSGEHARMVDPAVFGAITLPADTVKRLSSALDAAMQRRKGPLLVHQLGKDQALGWLSEHANQLLAVPLMRQDQILGCMFALDKMGREFDSVDAKLLGSIANESAIYLENAMLFEDVHGLMMGLLHSLTSAVDAKDAYTCGHSERVALLARELAARAGQPEVIVERVYMAGLLHDVGKIGVSEAVLRKTGKLSDEEFAEIKRHPEIGARILKDVKQIQDIIPGVLHHHERFDGRGYPSGLSGENIPLFGRLICLADCFDAMTSSRTYRKALPLEVALTEIRRCAGTQFDPMLSDQFLAIGETRLRELLRDDRDPAHKKRDLQLALKEIR